VTNTLANLNALKAACRYIMFDTDYDDWAVATNGGTMFVVTYQGTPYGLTARHNKHAFEWNRLLVTNTKFGHKTAGLDCVYFTSGASGAAVGSDIADLLVIKFASHISARFFKGRVYDLGQLPISAADIDDSLIAYGTISEKSTILDKQIAPVFAELGLQDNGANKTDPVLRDAIGKWENTQFSSVAGISGGPVFNVSRGGLSGLVVRGGLQPDGRANVYYIDIQDIIRFLGKVHDGQGADSYVKYVKRRERA
jgi:hypothetical protein